MGSVKETRYKRKLKQREAKNERYEIIAVEGTIRSLENEVMILLIRNLNYAHSQFVRWKVAQNTGFQDRFADFTSVWVHWLHYDILNYAKEFEGRPINPVKKSKINLRSIRTTEEFWGNLDVYDDILPLIWRIRVSTGARNQLLKMTAATREAVLRRLVNFATGYINPSKAQKEIDCKLILYGPCANMGFFSSYIEENVYMVFCVELNRFPHANGHNLIYYSLEQHIKVISFLPRFNLSNDAVNTYTNSIKNNPDCYIENEKAGDFDLFGYSAENTMRRIGNLYFPQVPSKVYLTASESECMNFNPKLRRWVSDENRTPIYIDLFSTGHPLIKKMASEESGTNFIKLLTSIPNFRIKLTEEQSNSVSSSDNIVILGRSGTGKTTCAVLRMFAAELLFRFKGQRTNRKFGPEDVGKTSVLHSAFVTASPVLTNEVKRFYAKLSEHVKEELAKKVKKDEVKEMGLVDLEQDEVKEMDLFSESDSDEETGPVSMNMLNDDDFPLFFTVRRLIFMIDASLRRPFFARDITGKVIGTGSNFEWHNEYKGSLKISRDYKSQVAKNQNNSESDSDEEEMEINYTAEIKLKYFEEKRKNSFRNRSFEVDFKVFKEKFWPKIKPKTKLSALVIWTEITGYIKGSASSYMYSGYYLPKTIYANQGHKTSLLTREEKCDVWELFIQYERWKSGSRAYDFQDIVNYILCQAKYYGYNGIPIHYMMVDEVQDLTPATISLLITVTKEKLVFSGDTAQTIAKGVGFRFCDLETLFYESALAKPKIYQLTMNFRTHNQILEMANSIVALLETLFPQTIDKMGKEVSSIDGPIPKVISSSEHLHLFYLLFGLENAEKSFNPSETQFGCNQVIIVRNQEAKQKLHPLLSHALCLTVFEAKGLEFDDVILYNFFTDSEVSAEKWRILLSIKKNNYYKPRDFEELQNSVPKLRSSCYVDQSKLSLLCTELKHLYVAITRPKRNLVIFDEDLSARRYMQEFWTSMGVIELLEPNEIARQIDEKSFDLKAIAEKTCADAWKIQGQRMMSHKFYEQAAKCFSVSGDLLLERKASAFAKASEASRIIHQADALAEEYYMNVQCLTKKVKFEIKEKITKAEGMFKEAGDEILIISKEENSKALMKQAAQCYASSKAYLNAALLFEEIGFKGQAAESYSSCGEYEKAAELFNERAEYVRAIQCYSLCQQWEKIIHCLHKHKDLIPEDERKKYVYKYMPVALEALMPKVLPNENSNYINKIVQEQKEVIKEAEENEEDDAEVDEVEENNA